MIGFNHFRDKLDIAAQQEINIMFALQERPQTPAELSEQVAIPINRVRHLLSGLRKAHCVVRVPGTHRIMLT